MLLNLFLYWTKKATTKYFKKETRREFTTNSECSKLHFIPGRSNFTQTMSVRPWQIPCLCLRGNLYINIICEKYRYYRIQFHRIGKLCREGYPLTKGQVFWVSLNNVDAILTERWMNISIEISKNKNINVKSSHVICTKRLKRTWEPKFVEY